MSYVIKAIGYHAGPEFPTLREARAALRILKQEELTRCKRRFGSGFTHSWEDGFSITLARDERSALWFGASILKV